MDIAKVCLNAVDTRVVAVVDFGETVRTKEGKLELLPDLVVDRTVPAQRTEGRLPADFIVRQVIGIVRCDVGAPVETTRAEAARPRRIEHQVFLGLPLRIDAVSEPTALGVLGHNLAILEHPKVSTRTARNDRREQRRIRAIELRIAQRVAARSEAGCNAGFAASGSIGGRISLRTLEESRIPAKAEESDQAVVIAEQAAAGGQRHLWQHIPTGFPERRIVAINAYLLRQP